MRNDSFSSKIEQRAGNPLLGWNAENKGGSMSEQIEVRPEMIARTTAAISQVRELVSNLNQREKDQLHHHSPEYRKLVDTIRDWYKPKPVMPPPLSAAEIAELEAEESES